MACALASVAGTPSLLSEPLMSSTRISPSASIFILVNALHARACKDLSFQALLNQPKRKPELEKLCTLITITAHLSMRGSFSSIMARNSSHLQCTRPLLAT